LRKGAEIAAQIEVFGHAGWRACDAIARATGGRTRRVWRIKSRTSATWPLAPAPPIAQPSNFPQGMTIAPFTAT